MTKIPITECAESILRIMQERGYSSATIKEYQRCFDIIIEYSKAKSIEFFDEQLALKYAEQLTGLQLQDLARYTKSSSKFIVYIRCLRLLEEYSRNQTFTPRFSEHYIPVNEDEYWQSIYDRFMNHLKHECDYADRSITHKELTIRLMLNIFIQKKVTNLNTITEKEIESVIQQFIHEAPKSVTQRIGEMKQFFKYCYDCELSSRDNSLLIPKISTAHETKLPISWSVEDVKKLLDSIDTSSRKGKRDYTILLIASRLGLRAVDLAGLNLSDFNWGANQITIRQKKTNNTITLPLLNDIGWAVIDYIKNARPHTDSTQLFISFNAPYKPLGNGAISSIFTRRFHEAGIPIPRQQKFGIHSLRHTLGSLMLEKETPLATISQVLGHQSIKSTETYLRINMDGLNECPIDPERVFDYEL